MGARLHGAPNSRANVVNPPIECSADRVGDNISQVWLRLSERMKQLRSTNQPAALQVERHLELNVTPSHLGHQKPGTLKRLTDPCPQGSALFWCRYSAKR